MAILFSDDTYRSDKIFQTLQTLMPGIDLRHYPDIGNPQDIDYAIIWRPKPGSLQGLPKLKAVFTTSAGVDGIIHDKTLPDVPIIRNTDPFLARGMAEYAVYHVLHYWRFFDRYEKQQSGAEWKQYPQRRAEDCIVGFMGLGEMAMPAATYLKNMGFQIHGWSRHEKHHGGIKSFHGDGQKAAFLSSVNFLVNVLPLTDATQAILNAELFAQLPKDAVVINIGRGQHLVEKDLIAALDSGHLQAAALDVFETEPLPPDSQLWAHPKIKITPHIASLTDYKNIVKNILQSISNLEQGLSVQGIVNRERQY